MYYKDKLNEAYQEVIKEATITGGTPSAYDEVRITPVDIKECPVTELSRLVDAEYESLEGMSKEDFYGWAAGMITDLTKEQSDEVYEQMLESIKEGKFSLARISNDIPPDSNWTEFAQKFDIGVIDLDQLADILGYKDFEDLDISISPDSLFLRDQNKFIKALKLSSSLAKTMKDDDIKDKVQINNS